MLIEQNNQALDRIDNNKLIDKENMLTITSGLLIGTLGATMALKNVINKDSKSKVVCLAFTISIISTMTVFSRGKIKLSAFYWTYCIILYLSLLWMFAQILQIGWFKSKFCSLVNSQVAKSHRPKLQYDLIFHNLSITVFTTIFLGISILLSIFFINLVDLLNEANLFKCLAVVLLSLFSLYLADHLIKPYLLEEAIRRKLFHLGPLVVVPIVNYMNPSILLAILSGGFYLFLLLEIIRYSLKNLKNLTNSKQKSENHEIYKENMTLQLIDPLFVWMSEFNSREKQFWFTHLFLIASLLLSYSFGVVTNQVYRTFQHIALCVIAADGMAALVGKRYGRMKVYGEKTLEGTLAFLLTFWIFIYSFGECPNFVLGMVLGLGCGLGELLGGDADNISTLLIYYSLMIGYSTFL